MSDEPYVASVVKWREEREASFRAENSWLALAGLFWLKPGRNRVGSDPANEVVLPARLASVVGEIDLEGGSVKWATAAGQLVMVDREPLSNAVLSTDRAGSPSRLEFDGLRLVIIDRAGRKAARVWDNLREERRSFPPRTWFPVNPALRFEARYSPFDSPLSSPVPDVAGDLIDLTLHGRLTFEREGATYQLDVSREDDGELFIRFWDQTAADRTYPSGRYLTADFGSGQSGFLDFNYAYNPPCAFTPYATCVFAPTQNRLPFRVEAGETYERH